MRKFDTGATRDSDTEKFDYEGFLSPQVVERFAAYMHKHRKQADGQLRASDNWQKGIPRDAYMKSMYRHFMEVWKAHRSLPAEDLEESLCAMMFNVQGMLFEVLNDPIRNITAAGAASSKRHSSAGIDWSYRPDNHKQPAEKVLGGKSCVLPTKSETTESTSWEDEAPQHPEKQNPSNCSDSSWGV